MKSLKTDDLRKLQQKKYRLRFGCFLAEGEHLVQELEKAAAHNPRLLESELYVTRAYATWEGPLRQHQLNDRQMASICDTQAPQGIIACVPFDALAPAAVVPQLKAVYLHEIQDPGNLGTILRTLGWLGNFNCLLSPGSVDPFNPKVVRASMGAIFHVPLHLNVPLEALGRFERLACLDMQGRDVREGLADFDCYLFGNEARGLPHGALESLALERFTIPGAGSIDSLNLATAISICAWEISRSR